MVAILIITGSIYFILLDELIIGSVQRRIGPLNLGWYGILSSIMNGCDIIKTKVIEKIICLILSKAKIILKHMLI